MFLNPFFIHIIDFLNCFLFPPSFSSLCSWEETGVSSFGWLVSSSSELLWCSNAELTGYSNLGSSEGVPQQVAAFSDDDAMWQEKGCV